MGKQDSETPGVCVRAYTCMCVCVCSREYKTGNAKAVNADTVTFGTYIQRTREKQILNTEEGFGETPGLDTRRHADNSKLPPHEFCSCPNLLDIFIQACSSFGKRCRASKTDNEQCEVGIVKQKEVVMEIIFKSVNDQGLFKGS